MTYPSVTITGVTGLQNRGVEALVEPTIERLLGFEKVQKIAVTTQTPDFDQECASSDKVEWIADPFLAAYKSPIHRLRFGVGRVIPQLGGKNSFYADMCSGADCIIATGGDVYSSDYGSFECHLDILRAAQSRGRKTVLLAHSIGPFLTSGEMDSFRRVASACSLITVRETPSYEYCLGKLGLSPDIVVQTADPGLLLAPADGWERIAIGVGVPRGYEYVTVSISQGISGYGKLSRLEHGRAWHSIIGSLLAMGLRVVLVPHVQRSDISENDLLAVTRIARELNWPEGLHIAGGEFTASEYKALIGGATFNIAERMHAAIAGLSQHVPTGVIGYSVKAMGILSDLYGQDLVQYGLLKISSLASHQERERFIEGFIGRKEEFRGALDANMPGAKEMAEKNFSLIRDIINQ